MSERKGDDRYKRDIYYVCYMSTYFYSKFKCSHSLVVERAIAVCSYRKVHRSNRCGSYGIFAFEGTGQSFQAPLFCVLNLADRGRSGVLVDQIINLRFLGCVRGKRFIERECP